MQAVVPAGCASAGAASDGAEPALTDDQLVWQTSLHEPLYSLAQVVDG